MKNIIKIIILSIFCIYSLFFLIGSILAPIMAHYGYYDFSAQLDSLYVYSCHRQPDRSFWFLGYPAALCSRCLGFYAGTTVFAVLVILNKISIKPIMLMFLSILTLLDIFINFILHINTSNIIRFFIGIIMGLLFVIGLKYIIDMLGNMKMKIKKIITGILLLFFSLSYNAAAFAACNMSLQEFLKTTDDIEAHYKYPSMKVAQNSSGRSVLPAHTPITIRCAETITTKDIASGSTVHFTVTNNVTDKNGNILIKAGTPVTAQITFAKPKGMIGKSGELTISDFHTKAVDGTYIPLSGSVSANPNDKMTTSIVLSVLLCPLFLLMKGNEARLEAGATKAAYTITDTYINTTSL